jgi:putative transposase
LGLPRSSFSHAQQPATTSAAPHPRPPSPRALSALHSAQIRQVRNRERFVERAPGTVYAILLDEGQYLCSWRTMDRILAADAATRERRSLRQHAIYARPELLATAPGQAWSWNITKLRGPVAGVWYSLYVILDIFSRKIVGGLIAERADAEVAEVLIAESCAREGIAPQQLRLHADRRAPIRRL